jgi:hypothetical protein
MIARIRCLITALATVVASTVALDATAHEIPADVRLKAFVKPAGDRLELLIRVPTVALVEVEFPMRGQTYLDMTRVNEALHSATKLYLTDNITVYENDAPLLTPRVVAVRVSLPSDKSFASFDSAHAHVQGPPLADDLDLVWNQQFLDVLLEYPIQSDRSDLAARFRVDRFGRAVSTTLRLILPGGETRAFEFHGDPGLLRLDPRWHQAALRFVVSGFWHILEGIDHLLFLLCLVIPFRHLRPLIIIVTSFTVAHSISLIASAFGFVPDALWFPPLIETLIAVTIVYMALENIVYAALGKDVRGEISRRWIIAFAFGIVHGFGFSFALRESLQFAGDHLVTSLLAFNVGVEIGQIVVLVALIPALGLLFRFAVPEWLGIIILSAFVIHTGWHWMLERGEQFAKFPFPKIDATFLASAMRGLMGMLVLAGGVFLANGVLKRLIRAEDVSSARSGAERSPRDQN